MATAILTNELHQDIKVDTRATLEFGDMVNRSIVFSSEFNEAHKEYPILLYRSGGQEEFSAHAILGFDQDENLFVDNEAWMTSYVPANIARGPFSLGYVRDGGDGREPVDVRVMIDEDNPRLGADGQAVFLELGGESPYLERIKRVLQIIAAGLRTDNAFYPLLFETNLLEQVSIQVKINEDQQYTFSDYYTIDQKKLSTLSESQLSKLNQSGALGLVFFLVSSLGNFRQLVRLKNARLAAA